MENKEAEEINSKLAYIQIDTETSEDIWDVFINTIKSTDSSKIMKKQWMTRAHGQKRQTKKQIETCKNE